MPDAGSEEKNRNKQRQFDGFSCMQENDGASVKTNPNAETVQILEKMASYYDGIGDDWRTLAYRKAIQALKKQTVRISTKEQAMQIWGIGERLALKIEEIATTKGLRRLDSARTDPDENILQLFMGIYQVGYPTAAKWMAQGFRTLEDLRKNPDLTPNQKIGLDHYHDFLERIPREEVEQHASVVNDTLQAVDRGLKMIIGGSYRRGQADSGDIDLIITKENTSLEVITALMHESVIPGLTKQGFLKAPLASRNSSGSNPKCGSKWHGASALSTTKTWRRIDLLFVPWSELGAALIYFTGNDIFNRSIRLLASRKKMRLNQHGLYMDVMRGDSRTRMTEGKLLESHSETRIFELLGVPWRPPEHRQC